jgi:hypothetical protein
MDDTTVVIFRKWIPSLGGDVIALFPEDQDPLTGLVQSFIHFGQHGRANYDLMMSKSRAATEEEYKDLKRELESPPYEYKLKVQKRRPK